MSRRPDDRSMDVDLIQCLPRQLQGARSASVSIDEVEHRVVASTAYVRERLRRDDEAVILIEQEVRADGRPLYVRVGYHPIELGLDELSTAIREVDTQAPIPDARVAFRRLFGRELGSSDTVLEAVAADVTVARALGLEPGDPVLLREQLLCDVDGVPWSLSWVHFRADAVTATTATVGFHPPPGWDVGAIGGKQPRAATETGRDDHGGHQPVPLVPLVQEDP